MHDPVGIKTVSRFIHGAHSAMHTGMRLPVTSRVIHSCSDLSTRRERLCALAGSFPPGLYALRTARCLLPGRVNCSMRFAECDQLLHPGLQLSRSRWRRPTLHADAVQARSRLVRPSCVASGKREFCDSTHSKRYAHAHEPRRSAASRLTEPAQRVGGAETQAMGAVPTDSVARAPATQQALAAPGGRHGQRRQPARHFPSLQAEPSRCSCRAR